MHPRMVAAAAEHLDPCRAGKQGTHAGRAAGWHKPSYFAETCGNCVHVTGSLVSCWGRASSPHSTGRLPFGNVGSACARRPGGLRQAERAASLRTIPRTLPRAWLLGDKDGGEVPAFDDAAEFVANRPAAAARPRPAANSRARRVATIGAMICISFIWAACEGHDGRRGDPNRRGSHGRAAHDRPPRRPRGTAGAWPTDRDLGVVAHGRTRTSSRRPATQRPALGTRRGVHSGEHPLRPCPGTRPGETCLLACWLRRKSRDRPSPTSPCVARRPRPSNNRGPVEAEPPRLRQIRAGLLWRPPLPMGCRHAHRMAPR